MSTITSFFIFPVNIPKIDSKLIECTFAALKPHGAVCDLYRDGAPDASWEEYLAKLSNEEEQSEGFMVFKEPDFHLYECPISEVPKHYRDHGLLTIDLARSESSAFRDLYDAVEALPAEVRGKFEMNSCSLMFGFHDICEVAPEIENARFIARPPVSLKIWGSRLPGEMFWPLIQEFPAMKTLQGALEGCWGRLDSCHVSY